MHRTLRAHTRQVSASHVEGARFSRPSNEGELMSKQQAAELAGILRQGRLDLNADVVSLRTAFNQVMSYVPVAEDVVQRPVSVGGVDAIEVTDPRRRCRAA